jgi:hypothetical protein
MHDALTVLGIGMIFGSRMEYKKYHHLAKLYLSTSIPSPELWVEISS